MYPILKECRVKGVEDDFYLQQYKNGSEFILESLHAQILWQCNGEHTIDWLSKKFFQPEEDIVIFLKILEKEGLLSFSKQKIPTQFASLTKSPSLQEVQIDATGKCNLYGICKHCYGKEYFQEATKNELTYEEMCGLIDQMSDLNVARCFLSGGEIFMRKDLPKLIAYLANKCIHLTGIFTNGTIYRQEVINALQQTGFNTSFLVSLDGHNAQIHDFMRGKGNFQKTIFFIKKIQEAGFSVTINTMVIKQNVKHLMAMCLFLENLGINRWRLSIPREQGEAIVNKELIIPKWQDIFDAYKQLVKHGLTKIGPMRMAISSIFKTELLKEKVYYLFGPENSCCEYKRWSLVIKPNGDIVPCTAFDNLVLGNIRKDALDKVWYSELTQTFKNLPVSATECNDCDIKKYCGAGCRKMAWELNKNVLAKDSNACPLYEFVYNTIRPMMKKHGIQAHFLKPPPTYRYNPNIINDYIT